MQGKWKRHLWTQEEDKQLKFLVEEKKITNWVIVPNILMVVQTKIVVIIIYFSFHQNMSGANGQMKKKHFCYKNIKNTVQNGSNSLHFLIKDHQMT